MSLPQHILCLFLPHWSIMRRYRRRPSHQKAAIAVIRSVGQRRTVIDVSAGAEIQGLRAGMSAAEARALCPNLHCVDENAADDQRTLHALGRWLIRFTPIVSCGWDEGLTSTFSNPADRPAVVFMDLTGSERLFGGIHRLVDRVKSSLARLGIDARMAVAPTPGAAWGFALTAGQDPQIIDSASFPNSVRELPVASLRLDDEIIENLHHLGLHRTGDVLALPREQLPSRFGPLLLKRLDQLIGVQVEPLTKLVTNPSISSWMEFDAPVQSLEDIRRILEKLLGLIVADLARLNHGVRQLRMIFTPDRGWGLSTIIRTICLSRPHRDRSTLFELIRFETERVDCEHGFIRFQLEVPLHESISEDQIQLFEQRSREEEIELDRLLQRLGSRLNEKAVIRAELVESYLPERAWRPAREDSLAAVSVAAQAVACPVRPLTLFPMPIEVRVVCEPSDDCAGLPRQFTWQGNIHRLLHAIGPERIAGEWWRGHGHTRDYYDTEDEHGQRFWMFRVLYPQDNNSFSARWFLHGRFE